MREATKKVTFLKIRNATFKLLYQFALKIRPIGASLPLIDILLILYLRAYTLKWHKIFKYYNSIKLMAAPPPSAK